MASPPVNPADLTMLRDLYDTKLAQGSGSDYVRGLMNERFEDALASWQSDQAARVMQDVPYRQLGVHELGNPEPWGESSRIQSYAVGGFVEPLDTPYLDYGLYGSPNQTFQTPPSHAADDLPAQVYGEGGRVMEKLAREVKRALFPESNPRLRAHLRFGEIPSDEYSRNFNTGLWENGTSVYPLKNDAPILSMPGMLPHSASAFDFEERLYDHTLPRYLIEGSRVGEGDDGEPLLRGITKLGPYGKSHGLIDFEEPYYTGESSRPHSPAPYSGEYAHGGPYHLAGWGHEPEPAGASFSHIHQSGPMHYGSSGGFAGGGRIIEDMAKRTANLMKWFGKSVAKDEEGKPLTLYHGTVSDFPQFDLSKANPESDWGRGFYFTNSKHDLERNYAGFGPDLTNKIERQAETHPDYLTGDKAFDDRIREEARSRLAPHEGASMPVYLRAQRPFILGGPRETYLDFDPDYNPRVDRGGGGKLHEFVQSLHEQSRASPSPTNNDVGNLASELYEHGYDGGIRASDLNRLVRESNVVSYWEHPETGDLIGHDVFGTALRRAGFDSVVDNTVSSKFKNMGINPDTSHYVLFDPRNIKSAIGNRGTYSLRDPDITKAEGGRFTLTPEERRELRINRAHDNRWNAQRIRDEAERDPGAYWRDVATQLPHGIASTAELAGLPGSVLDALEISGGKYGSHLPLPTAEGIHGGLESIFGAPQFSGGRASYDVGSLLPMMGVPELAPSRLGHAGNALALGSVLGETPGYAGGGKVRGYAGGGKVRGYAEGGRRIAAMAKYIADRFGKTQARRFERAGDETDLSRFDNLALRELFDPARSGLLTSMPPGEFEKYALGLPASSKDVVPYPRWENIPSSKERYKEDWSHPERMTQDNYVKLLGKHIDARGMTEPPSLWMFRHPDDLTAIEGHEGRHRMRALDSLGDENSLVHLLPVNVGEYRHPINERVPILQDKYFPEGKDTLILPEGRAHTDELFGSDFKYRPLSPFPNEAFAGGGPVFMEKGGPLSGLIKRGAKELKEFVGRLREPDGGFTWQPHTNDQPSSGYAVSIFPERSHVLDSKDVTTEALHDYLRRNEDLLSDPVNHFGAWHDPETGKAHMDISVVTPQEAWAQELARRHNQKTYFDFSDFSSHPPPHEEIPTYKKGGIVDSVSRLTRKAAKAMMDLLEVRSEGFDPKNPVYLPPDPSLQRFIKDPVRMAYPGIYKRPDDIAQEAADLAASKSPDLGRESNLFKVFGVQRGDLPEIMRSGDRWPSDVAPAQAPTRRSGSKISDRVLTPENMQHQLDVFGETMGHQHLFDPSSAWYEMSPAWDRAESLGQSPAQLRELNNVMGMFSPASAPKDEIARGLAARYYHEQGRLQDFIDYGGLASHMRGPDFPHDMMDVPGHLAHKTAHTPMLQRFYGTGELGTDAVKVPHYIAASDPAGPFRNNFIGDSHIARNLAFPDVRTSQTHGTIATNLSNSEFWDAVPFYREMAEKAGIDPTSFQSTQWNAFGPQTGVETVGVPKLEILADHIARRAGRKGLPLDLMRDRILKGEDYARGGSVDDDYLGYLVQNYAAGGPVDDFYNQYQSQYFNEGGYVNG